MKPSAIYRYQRLCTWCGPLCIVLFLSGYWLIADLWPMPGPNVSATALAELYRENSMRIRAGSLMTMFAAGLLAPFAAAITVQMRRIEGRFSTLAYLQLTTGGLLVLGFVIPLMFLETAVFRPERDPNMILLLSDVCWIFFVGNWFTIFFQYLSIGGAALADDRSEPVFQRWVGYVCVWVGLLSVPAGAIYFLKDGPLAWNGVFSFWIPAIIFVIWVLTMTYALLRAISRQERDDVGGSTVPGADRAVAPA